MKENPNAIPFACIFPGREEWKSRRGAEYNAFSLTGVCLLRCYGIGLQNRCHGFDMEQGMDGKIAQDATFNGILDEPLILHTSCLEVAVIV